MSLREQTADSLTQNSIRWLVEFEVNPPDLVSHFYGQVVISHQPQKPISSLDDVFHVSSPANLNDVIVGMLHP